MTAAGVPVSTAVNLLGPYLTAEATCPACRHLNDLVHLERYAGTFKPVDVCSHLRKQEAGALLDGHEYREFPAPAPRGAHQRPVDRRGSHACA